VRRGCKLSGHVIAEKLRKARLEAKITQVELSNRTSIQVRQIRQVESGGRGVSIDTLLEMAYAIGVEPGDLLPTRDEIPKIMSYVSNPDLATTCSASVPEPVVMTCSGAP